MVNTRSTTEKNRHKLKSHLSALSGNQKSGQDESLDPSLIYAPRQLRSGKSRPFEVAATREKSPVPLSMHKQDENKNSDSDDDKPKRRRRRLPRDPNANKCSKCNKSFSSKHYLQAHSEICGQSEDVVRSLSYNCDHCNYKTILKSNLVNHIQDKHLPRDPDEVKCGKCNKRFYDKYYLRAHLEVCGKSEDVVRSLSYNCDNCSFKTLKKSNLATHIQEKHLLQDHKCHKCAKIFSWQSSLSAHLKTCGQSENRIRSSRHYICDHCNYKAIEKGDLSKHIKAKHLPRDPNANKCKKCKKTFSQSSNLFKHLKICGKSKDSIPSFSFNCDHCSYKTGRKDHLATHIKNKHSPQDSKANKCSKCKKNFSNHSNFLAHSRVCGQSEEVRSSLMRHACDHCNYKTAHKGHLNRHINRMHNLKKK